MRSFFDTNLLVYADAADEPVKQQRAVQLIKTHRAAGTAVLSTQVLQEFVNVALRKLGLPMPLIRERLSLYARFDLVPATPELIEGALALNALHGTSFYDALVLQAAIASGCSALLTEDMRRIPWRFERGTSGIWSLPSSSSISPRSAVCLRNSAFGQRLGCCFSHRHTGPFSGATA